MDWPRAKTILIIAFTGLNLFLAYHLYAAPLLPVLDPTYLAVPSESRVEEMLASFGVEPRLPERWPSRLLPLKLEPASLDVDPAAILGPVPIRSRPGVRDGSTGTLYWSEGQELFVADAGWIDYTSSLPPPRVGDVLDLPTAIQTARDFVERLGGFSPSLLQGPVQYDPDSETLSIRYEQQITEVTAGSLVLFDSFVDVDVTSWGISRFRWQLWRVTGNAGKNALPVMPVTTLLLRHVVPGGVLFQALEPREPAPDPLEPRWLEAELGYAIQAPVVNGGARSEQIAFPVWRVNTGGTYFYFDAVTGELLPVRSR